MAILWADPQPHTQDEVSHVRDDVVEELVGTSALFGITVGGIMFDDLSLLPRFNRLVARIGVPRYNVPGNHELNFESPDDEGSLDTFKRHFGPPYYSFDYVEDRAPVAMERRYTPDPWLAAFHARDQSVWKRWFEPRPSTHIWVAKLPDDLGPGVYTLTVRATDEFGRVHHGHEVLELPAK